MFWEESKQCDLDAPKQYPQLTQQLIPNITKDGDTHVSLMRKAHGFSEAAGGLRKLPVVPGSDLKKMFDANNTYTRIFPP